MSVQLCSVYLTSETSEFGADIKMLLTLRGEKSGRRSFREMTSKQYRLATEAALSHRHVWIQARHL